MPEPNAISPLLDGLITGQPISDHHGIQCCPALREGSGERFMVKIISIPASQAQLDALLLTGAFPNELKAQEYFAAQADAVTAEAELLDRLSKTEGYLPYQATQIVKMEDGVGFHVYLLAPYRDSLEERLRQEPLTHLAAVNLGLDMCAAMAACRRAGYLYLDMKPSNIYMTENRGYCIGDLGFMRLSSLPFASFPEKYRSRYTAPEIQDAMSSMDQTLDIYALGLTLYQVYNNGQLPEQPELQIPPQYADYEMAQIILKACATLPEDRWQSPAEMGQALVEYMQRNEVNDVSIIPPPVEFASAEPELEDFLSEEENDAELAMLLAMIPDEEPPPEPEDPAEETPPDELPEEDTGEDPPDPDAPEEEPPDDERTEDGVTAEVAQILAQADELIEHELPEPVVAPDPIDIPIPPPIISEPEPEPVSEPDTTEDPPEVIEDPPDISEGEPPPEEPPPEAEDDEETDDMPEKTSKKISAKLVIRIAAIVMALVALAAFGIYYYNNEYTQTIDKLEVSGTEDEIRVRIYTTADTSKLSVTCTDTYGNTTSASVESDYAIFRNMKPDTQYKIEVTISGTHKLVGQTTASYTTGSQTKVMNLTAANGSEADSVVLSFSVQGPDSDSWVVEYGATNIATKKVTFEGHSVELTGLVPEVEYTFRVTPVDELYLAGTYKTTFTIECQTDLTNLKVVNGLEDGSVRVTFDVEGTDSEQWKVTYFAADAEEQEITFSGHSVDISDLTPGVEYTFLISPVDDLIVAGTLTTKYTIQDTILAEDLTITSYYSSFLSVTWTAPAGAEGTNWTVRCYNDSGYDQTIETNGLSHVFSDLEAGKDYTITVTAQNMTKNVSVSTEGMTPIDDTTQDPDQGGTTQPPEQGGTTQDPEQGGTTQDPEQGSTTQDPEQGDNTQTPDQGQTAPDQGDTPSKDPDEGSNNNATEPVAITGFSASTSTAAPWNLKLSWSYTGKKPSGWILTYTTNSKNPIVIKCSENSINIIVSSDDVYVFEVRPADDIEYTCEPYTYTAKKDYYTGNGFDASNASYSLQSGGVAGTSFSSNSTVYICAEAPNVDTSATGNVDVTIWIRNASGDIISSQSGSVKWSALWADGKCLVEIPELPDAPGTYTVDLLFDYLYVTYLELQIV